MRVDRVRYHFEGPQEGSGEHARAFFRLCSSMPTSALSLSQSHELSIWIAAKNAEHRVHSDTFKV